MKKTLITLLFLLGISSVTYAEPVGFIWDAVVTAEGYAVFARDHETLVYGDPSWSGTETTCIIEVPDDRYTAFVCRAWRTGVPDLEGNPIIEWSPDSDEIVWIPSVGWAGGPGNFSTTEGE